MILTLKIDQRNKDGKILFEYLQNLSYVKIVDETDEIFYSTFKKSVGEAKKLAANKKRGKSLNALLDEL